MYPTAIALVTALLALLLPRRSIRFGLRRLRDASRRQRSDRDSVLLGDPREAIEAVARAYVDALLRGDADGYACVFHDDAIVVPGGGAIRRGRSAIEDAVAKTFTTLRFLEAEMSTVDFRLTGETAIETGRYRFVVYPYLESRAEPRTASGRYALVWKRVAGAWRISLDVGQPGLVEA